MPSNDDIQFALNEHRLIVLLENDEGKFEQVKLSPARFKAVSDASFAHRPKEQPTDLKPGMDVVCQHTKEGWELDSDLFLGLSSCLRGR